MTHYKLYSLHLGCGEPLATQYKPQHPVLDKKCTDKKSAKVATKRVTGRKRK